MMRSDANKCNRVLYQISEMDKSVTSHEIRETTVEAMFVDNETNQLNPSPEGEPSTPERPSGPSLEEPLPMHVEPEIKNSSDNSSIIVDMCIMSRVEDAVTRTADDIWTEVNDPQQSNPPSEERLVSTRHNYENNSSIRTDKDLIWETQLTDQNIPALSKINSESNKEQPSTPERSSDPSLE